MSDWLRDRHAPRWDHLDLLERLLITHGVDIKRGLLAEKFRVHVRDAEPAGAGGAVYPHAPIPLTPLVGREIEVERLMALWEQHRLVCVTGPAGVGKTRLAAAVADRINDKSPGAITWLRVEMVREADELYQLVALALHARTFATNSILNSIARAIGDQPRTIVLDELDGLVDRAGGAVVRLLEHCAQLRIIATSRRGPETSGAARFRVDPLDLPPEECDDDDARGYPALRLFTALAAQSGNRQAVDRASVAQVSEVCRALGGLPFCLELAAAQLDAITVHELHQHLMAVGQLNFPLRSATAEGDAVLEMTLGSSWNTLSSLAQHTLACSSVFNGSFGADRSARVAALSSGAAQSALHELVRSSMLQVDHSKLRSTYHILGPLRHFAARKLDEGGDGEEVRARHARHVADILVAQFPQSHAEAVERIGWGDLLGALRWASDADPALSLRIAANLWPQWSRVGAFATGREWLTRVVEAYEGSSVDKARALIGAGVLAQREGDAERSASLLENGLEMARTEGDGLAEQVALVYLGWLALVDGRGDEALQYADVVLGRPAEGRQRWGRAEASRLRGRIRLLRDDRRGVSDLEASLAMSTEIEDVTGAIEANLLLSRVALRRGDSEAARGHATAGLDDAERIGDMSMTGAALVGVGMVAKAEGRWDEAAALFERAAELMARSEEPIGRCRTLLELALVRAHASDARSTERATDHIAEATKIAIDGNVKVLLPLCFETMSEVAAPADASWLQDAAAQLRCGFGLVEGDDVDQTSVQTLIDAPPDSAALATFVEIFQRVADGSLGEATS